MRLSVQSRGRDIAGWRLLLERNLVTRKNQKIVLMPDAGKPLQLDLSLIDEDPQQPRKPDSPGFARASLDELAATIKLRGVKTPISVRKNPADPARYIINHGERRVRASRLAGMTTVPAFIDDDYNGVDQVIENLQRNQLTAREIAEFIGRELAKGRKKGDIALSIGKSAAFVTQHAALLKLPEQLQVAFSSGRINDVTLVNELMKSYRLMPDHVERWLSNETQDITRGSVKMLRDFLTHKLRGDGSVEPDEVVRNVSSSETEKSSVGPQHARRRSPVVRVAHRRREAVLLLYRAPSREGHAWLRYEDNEEEAEVALAEVKLTAVVVA